MYIYDGSKYTEEEIQNAADKAGLSLEEYTSKNNITFEEEVTEVTEVKAEEVDFPTSTVEDADAVQQPMTASQAEYVEPEDTELAPVDTSLDSQDPNPRFIEFKGKGNRPGAIVYEDTYLKTKAGQPGYPDTFDEYATAFDTTPQSSSTEEIAIKATSNEKVFESLTNAAQGISYNKNTGNFDSDSSNTGLFKQEEEVSKKTFNKLFTGSGVDFEETDIIQEGDVNAVLGSEALRARIKNPETDEYIYSEILELESDGSFKNNDKIQKFLDENKSYLDLPGWTRSKNKMIAKYKQWENNELDPMLKKERLKADQAYIINPDLFKPYDKKINVGGYNTSTTVTETIHPYQKEIAQEVNRLERKGLKGDLEAIAKINVRQNLKQADINEAIRETRAKFINAASNTEEAQAFLYASETFVKKEEAKAYNETNKGGQVAAEGANKNQKQQQIVIDASRATPSKNQSVDDFILQQKNKLQPIIDELNIEMPKDPNERINSPKLNMLLGLDEEVMLPKGFVNIMTALESAKNANISDYNNKRNQMSKSIGKISDIDIAMDATAKNYELVEKYAVSTGLGFQDIVVNTGMLGLNILSLGQSEKVEELGSNYVEYTKEIRDSYQRDVSFEEAFSSPGNTGKFVMQEVANQIPIFAAIMASGGAAAYVVGASSAGGKMMDMQNEIATGTAEYSPIKLWGTSLGYGLAEGLFAQITTVPILRRAKLNWMNGGKESVVNNSMKEYTKKQVSGLIYEPISEAAGEAATVGAQNLMDGKPFMQGMDHASTSGLAFGFAFAAIPFFKGMYNSQFSTYETRSEIRTIQNELNVLNKDLNMSLLSTPSSGINFRKAKQDLLKRSIEEKSIQLADKIKQQEVIVANNLTEGGKNKVVDIINLQAELENKAIKVQENPNLSNKERVQLIAEIKSQYDFVVKQRNEAVKDETMLKNGTEWAAFKGLDRLKSQEYLDTADAILSGERNGKQASKEDINDRAYDLYFGDKVRIENKKQGKSNSSLFKNFKSFDTVDEAITEINNDDTIAPENKKDYIQRLKQGNDGYWNPVSDTMVAIVENQVKNQRKYTKTHEVGHKAFEMLLGNPANNAAFKGISDQILSTLKATDKKTYDKFIKDGIDDDAGNIDPTEVISRFMEYVAEDKITNVQKAKGISGLFGVMIQKTFGSDYKFDFRGEQDIFNFVVGFGKKLKDGTLTTADIKKAKESKVIKDLPTFDTSSEASSKVSFSKSVTDLQTELDNLDQSDFDFDLDQFENAKDNLKFKINAAKKKELAKPKRTEFDIGPDSPIGKINALVPKEITTNEKLRSNERVGLAIKKALAPNGIISNEMKGRGMSPDQLEIALRELRVLWKNYNPSAKRKTDSKVPITFGEWVMSNAIFAIKTAKKEVAIAAADRKNKTDLDNKEAQSKTNKESSESTSDTRKTYKPLTSNPKLIPGFVVTEIKNKLTNVTSKLTSKLSTRPKGKNSQTTPLIEEIKKAIGKVVGDTTALPKQIINRMGNPKDGSYQKFLIDNKKSILENMTTTYLMTAIPAAIEKSVGGAYVLDKNGKIKKDSNKNDIFKPKFVPYPEWVGKEIDREKVSTNKKGNTAGNQIVRRAIQVEVDGKFEDSITDEDFVANFVGSDGKVIRGKRESLGKALAEEAGFEVLTKELQDDRIITQKDLDKDTIGQFEGKQVGDFISDIRQMFESNQKALGEVLADNFVQQVTRDAERGTVKFSTGKAFRTTIKEIDTSIDNIINYLNEKNIYNVGGFGMLNELSLKNDDLFKLMKKNRELWQAYVLQGNKSKLTPSQQKKFLNIKNKSGIEYQKWINNSLNYYFNAIDATFGLEPGVAILQNPSAKAAALDTMRKLLKNIISTNKINPIEEFLNITKGWTVSGKSTSIFGNNTGLYNWITSIESVEIQNAVSESGLNLRSSKGSETNKTLYLNNKKALNTIKQETIAKDFISIYKGENKVELTDRDTQSNIAKKDLKTIFDFLQKQYTEKTILPEGVALILKTMNSSMRSPLKTAAKIEGAYLVEGLEAGDYTFEHGIPVTVISTMAAKYITDPKFKWDNIKNAIDKSKVYIIPKKIAKIIDTFYKATFSIDNALDTENPAIYRYQEVNKGLKDALKAAGVVNFDFNNFTYFRDPKKSVKRNIKFSKGVELNLVETGQQAINNARSLAYNNNVKRLDVKAEDISELTTNKAKADWLINKIAEGYNDFYFIDNKMNEVKAVKNVLNTFDVKGKVQQAKVKFSKSMNTTFNEMLQRSTGIEAGETIERSIARRRGATKGKFKVWMPSSLDDFKGLTSYVFAGKGRQGEADQKFFQDALITPYFRGVRAIEQSRQAFKDDFKALNKQMRPVLKKLGKIVPGTEFTHDQAIRVALWTASGYDIPGISESDIKTLVDFVNDNADLSEYTRKLQLISKRKEWSKPGDFWDAETILSDLNNLTEKVGRKEYLTEFIENVDIIFSEDNLNKVEAGYGEAQKDALKDVIYRMKNGTNRPSGSNKNQNRFNNWVNNSIGAIMFFNRRSALLQTLSIANFINWGDNNVLKAGAAFANQPQYWKDFATLFNSSKLKQRRSGLKSDVNEAEIASAVKGSRNKAVAALSYLLKIGFTPTQLADSFAIASGGATFYRNRANSYLKEVNAEGEKVYTQKQAEEKAFEDFSQISEETQQSGDPALISSDQASTLGRLLLAFQNAPIQLNRSIKKAALDIKNRRRTPGQTMLQSDFSNISKIIYYGTVQNIIFSALQNALFALIPGFEDEDDELTEEEQLEKYGKIYSTKQSRIVNGMVDTTLKGGFGVPGAFISTIKNAYLEWEKQKEKGFIGDQGYTILAAVNFSPPVGSKLRKIYSAIKTEEFDKDIIAKRGWDITIDGKFNLSPKYKVLAGIVEGATNLPLDRMVAEVSSITEALDARNSKWQRIALSLGWKTWDVNVKNEEHELIKTEAKAKRKEEGKIKAKENRAKNKKIKKLQNERRDKAFNTLSSAQRKETYKMNTAESNAYLDKIAKQKGIK